MYQPKHSAQTLKPERSAILNHLLENKQCLDKLKPELISILCQSQYANLLHLEALWIKKIQPVLCKQIEFVKSLHLFL